jgi:hypothetical protein
LAGVARAESLAERYGGGEEPTPPEPLPSAYRDYQVLPGTLSPDQHFGLLYPKRSVLYELHDYGLFLVAFRPFRRLSRLPLGYSSLSLNARCDYACRWAADSSAVVFVAGSRWGPVRVSAVSLRAGSVRHRVELSTQVRRLVRPDFVRSGAPRYNDYYDFVFSEDYLDAERRYTEIPAETGWVPDTTGRVHVDCLCTNSPKFLAPGDWKVHFTGVWDFERSCFTEHRLVRIPEWERYHQP